MPWRPVSEVFEDETEAVRALVGERVRLLTDARYHGFDGVAQALAAPVSLREGEEGFIANPWRTSVLVALPAAGSERFANLDKLMRSGRFHLVAVDWTEFPHRFEIDL